MPPIATCFFSQLIGKTVYTETGESLGVLQDIAVSSGEAKPGILALILRDGGSERVIGAAGCRLDENDGRPTLFADGWAPEPETHTVRLKETVLNRKVVDLQGKRIVRVRDLRLAQTEEGFFVAAVDSSFEARLRRWGLDNQARRMSRRFGSVTPIPLIPWEEIEAVDTGHQAFRAKDAPSNLTRLHPADLADILEDLDPTTQLAVFSTLDDEQAADVLEELESDVRIGVIEGMSVEKAADILERMPADEAADLLDELHETKAEALLNEMELDSSEDVRELMEYPENAVGSLMSTDYVSFFEDHTVDETIRALRQTKPEPDSIYYLYVVDSEDRLAATVSLRDIIIAEPEQKLSSIMNRNTVCVQDTDRIDILNEIIAKYSLLAVPVVDGSRKLVGMVVINDVMETLLKARRIRI